MILLKKARQEKKVKRYLEDNFRNREGKTVFSPIQIFRIILFKCRIENIFTSDPLKTGNTFQTCFTPLNHHETTYHCVLKDLQVIICLG